MQTSDIALLKAFENEGSQTSFDLLVERHVNMVFATAMRRTGNRQLAEEVTQNVFLSLSRKAKQLITKSQHLTSWLHLSTRYEANNLMRRESRLKKRERAYAEEHAYSLDQTTKTSLDNLIPLLDRAIDKLRPPEREAIILRYLENYSLRDVGNSLGISEDAAQKRVSRALEKMIQFFKQNQGATISAAALTTTLSQQSAQAAPAACVTTCKAIAAEISKATIAQTLTTIIIMNKTIVTCTSIALIGVASLPFLLNDEDTPKTTNTTTPAKTKTHNQENPTSTLPKTNPNPPTDTTRPATRKQTQLTQEQIRAKKIKQLHNMITNAIKDGGNKRSELKVTKLPDKIITTLEDLYLEGSITALEEVENGHAPGEYDFEGENPEGRKYHFTLKLTEAGTVELLE